MVWASLLTTVQPAGITTVSLSFEALVAVWFGVCDGTGLGEPAGLGLESEWNPPVFAVVFPKPLNASTVPQPAMITMSPAITAMIATQGVRWTPG
jgi:hypothetical protein